jgi:flavin reductase (DIM6/NTAB) family NADH-FMN oxidoreductase RutF
MKKNSTTDFSKINATFSCFPTVLITCNENIITVTLVHVFSFSPLLIGIGIKPERYSYSLIKESKEFVVNIPTKGLLKATIFCGTKSGKDFDKFKETNLTKEVSEKVRCVSINECPVNIECKVIQEVVTGDRTWFVGEVVNSKIADNFNVEDSILYWKGKYRIPGTIIN